MPSAPTVVQAVTNHNSGASFLAAPIAATTAGNLVVVIVQAYSATAVTGLAVSNVTLGAQDNFVQAFSQTVQANNWVNSVWLDPNCSGGLTAADITLSGSNSSTQLNVIVYEITGWLPGYPLDILTTTYSLTAGMSWSLTASDTQASALWLGVFTGEGGSAFTLPAGPGSGWATNGTGLIPNSVSPAFTRMEGWSNPQTSQGPVTFSGTTSANATTALIALAIPGSVTPGAVAWPVSDPTAGTPGQSGVWGCPPGVSAVTPAITGPGGGGAGGTSGGANGGGGGGGGYGTTALAVTAGYLAPFATGAAGAGGSGNSNGAAGGTASFAGTAATLTVSGGAGGVSAGSGGAGGAGGGTTSFTGGGGAAAAQGSGGGSSAGTAANGNNANSGTGATAPTGGGPGGNGGTSQVFPTSPASGPGGGGGGGSFSSGSAQPGRAGWAGRMTLTYTITPTPPSLIIPGLQPVRRASFW